MKIYTLENIDRSIYNSIRLALISGGYLADISDYAGNPDKEAGLIAYQTANSLISPLIEVFGVGTGASKLEKTTNKIIVERKTVSSGNIGGSTPIYAPIKVGLVVVEYEKTRYPDLTSNIAYDIRVISSGATVDRIIFGLLNKIFGRRKRVSYFTDFETDSGHTFGTVFNGSSVIATGQTNSISETIYSYTVPNVFLDEGETPTIVVPMTSVEVKVSYNPNSEDAIDGDEVYNDTQIIT